MVTANSKTIMRFMISTPSFQLPTTKSRRPEGLRLPGEALIGRLDEHIRRPGTRGPAVPRVVVQRGSGGLDLLERHFLRNHVLDAVADNAHHLAVIRDVGLIREPPVPGNDQRSAL